MEHLRYVPVTQQPYCCVPACIQMVLLRRGLQLRSQEEIGKELGLIVPDSQIHLLPHAYTGLQPTSGWGTRVGAFTVDAMFRRLGYRLRERYVDADHLPADLGAYIGREIAVGNDVLACFKYSSAFGNEIDAGHVVVVESVDDDVVTVIDPYYLAPKIRTLTTERLAGAIDAHGTVNRAGFWIIEDAR